MIVDGRVIQETYGVGQFPLNNYLELVVPVVLGSSILFFNKAIFIFISEKCEFVSVHMEILHIDYSKENYFNPLVSYVSVINETMVYFSLFSIIFSCFMQKLQRIAMGQKRFPPYRYSPFVAGNYEHILGMPIGSAGCPGFPDSSTFRTLSVGLMCDFNRVRTVCVPHL